MQPINVSVLLSGSGTNLEALLTSIREQALPAKVVQVISNKAEAYGLVRAQQQGIPCCVLSRDDEASQLLDWLKNVNTDLVVLAGYLKKVPDEVLEAYANRIINIHPSLIPAFSGPGWHGMKVHEGVWERGVKVTGATVHFVNGEMDGGPIILQESLRLEEEDEPREIQQKVLKLEHKLLPRAVALFAAGMIEVRQGRTIITNEVNQR